MSIDPTGETALHSLQAAFAHFARHECPDDPLYVALASAAAARADWAALLAAAPATQRSPTLWLAALQDRVLELTGQGRRPALADYYPGAHPPRPPDAELPRVLADFIDGERTALRHRIATRATQTNEIGRCAVLWPILRTLAQRHGKARLALLDVGCSAGLNLGVDLWRHRYVDERSGAMIPCPRAPDAPPDDDTLLPETICRVIAGSTPPFDDAAPAPMRIVSRLGLDPSPVAVDDPDAVRWLRACLWPHDASRRTRFDRAVAIARTRRWPLRATTDTTAAIGAWLRELPQDVTPVVFNSWVLAYLDPQARRAHVAALERWIPRHDAVWISAESPAIAREWWPDLPAPQPPGTGSDEDGRVGAAELSNATVWTVARKAADGTMARQLAARSHAHGRWMQWRL